MILTIAAFARVRKDDNKNKTIITSLKKKLISSLSTKRVIIPTTPEYIVSEPNVDGYLSNPNLEELSTKNSKGPK